MKLHHTVVGTLAKEHGNSIERVGIIPYIAEAYKDLVPKEIRHLPVIWFAEGIWQGWEFPVFEVESDDLEGDKLYPCAFVDGKSLNWWVYQGHIPRSIIARVQIPSHS